MRNCRKTLNTIALTLWFRSVPMLRQAFTDRLKQAMKAREMRTVSTIRLILAGLKDRDIAARTRQRRGSLRCRDPANAAGDDQAAPRIDRASRTGKARRSCTKGAGGDHRHRRLSPRQFGAGEIEAAAKAAITETGAASAKDIGKVMAVLRERHTGVIDLGQAGMIVRRLLG